MGMKSWEVKVLSHAKEQMRGIKDHRIQEKFIAAFRRLEMAPEQQGKQLDDELREYRSVRAVNQRYRIIYFLREDFNVVFIVGIGIRKEGDKKDIYAQTKKYLRRGLFNLNIEVESIINIYKEKPSLSTISIESDSSVEHPALSDAENSSAFPQIPTNTEDS